MAADVYQAVTDRIVEALEKGTVPWRVPWVSGGPISLSTGKNYRGINLFLLGITQYGDPRWGTFKAARETAVAHARSQGRTIHERISRKGKKYYVEVIDGKEELFKGGVRKGETGTSVILWKPVKRSEGEGEDATDSSYLLLRSYSVFNGEQIDGLPELQLEFENDPIERAEEIVAGYEGGPGVLFGGGSAYYSPAKDLVRCPDLGSFRKVEGYYSTLFHELIHSTGHESRLKRIEPALFGTEPYAQEELVAEMGAAMLCGMAGIDNLDQSAAYLDGWLERLRNDRKLVVQAAAQAQKGADLILGTTFEEKVTEQKEEALV